MRRAVIGGLAGTAMLMSLGFHPRVTSPVPSAPSFAPALDDPERSAYQPQRSRGRHPPVSAGHVKKPDFLCMRPVEHTDRLGGRLQ
jgi:hypothetical protein